MRRTPRTHLRVRPTIAFRRTGAVLAASIVAVGAVSCGSDDRPSGSAAPVTRDVGTATTSTIVGAEAEPAADGAGADDGAYSIDWEPLTDRIDAGWITVPLDYGDPDGATIDLRVARHRADADDRIGVLMANNGGPGAAASTIALNATTWFGGELTDRFDIVSWDPRGTGESSAIDCIDDDEYDRYYASPDITPDDEGERTELVDLAREFAEGCIARNGDVLQYVNTNNTARDADAIRQALGEAQASFFGFSYGSELGGVWATMFPTTVRAAVFDGATDPGADPTERDRAQRVGFEAALATFLGECSERSDCAFHSDGDVTAAFDALWSSIDESPLPTVDGRAPANLLVGRYAVIQAMFNERSWDTLAEALSSAADGDGSGLLALHDTYLQRAADGTYGDLIEAFQAITCADEVERPTVEEDDRAAEELADVAPRTYPFTTGSYFCTFFPPALDPRLEITGIGAGPIVVIGTTGDPSTPLASSRAMADSLEDGRLVIVEANRHTGYHANQCAQDVVHDYLILLEPPVDGTTCS